MVELTGKLVFGTAALGLPYGLPAPGRDTPELIPEEEAIGLVREAFSSGISRFDTAPAYGCAEERLGCALAGAGQVWTKFGHDQDWMGAEACLRRSLDRLHREHVDLLQVHNWTPEIGNDLGFRSACKSLLQDGRVKGLGCSTYGTKHAKAAVSSGLFTVVQVEWNLLNQAIVTEIEKCAATRGVAIAVRSIFLQGVLTAKGEHLPTYLKPLAEARAHIGELARSWCMDLPALALRAALDHTGITYVLIGIDGKEQLKQALATTLLPPLNQSRKATLSACHIGGAMTDPRTWRRMAP